jgi:hypothetical protein
MEDTSHQETAASTSGQTPLHTHAEQAAALQPKDPVQEPEEERDQEDPDIDEPDNGSTESDEPSSPQDASMVRFAQNI